MKCRKVALWLGIAILATGFTAVAPVSATAEVDPLDPSTGDVRLDTAGVLYFDGGHGDNDVRIVPDANGRVRVIDDNFPIYAGGGCIALTDNEVRCSAGATKLYVDGRGGDDTIINLLPTSSKTDARLFGGKGNDVIYGGPGVQWVSGGSAPTTCASTRASRKRVTTGSSAAVSSSARTAETCWRGRTATTTSTAGRATTTSGAASAPTPTVAARASTTW